MTAGSSWSALRPRHRRLCTSLALLVAGVLGGWQLAATSAVADVSHVGWPHTVVVEFAGNTGATLIGTDGNNMLLGGPGSDTIIAGPGSDILWGDRYPEPDNPTNQTDRLYGGGGNDWIYASHGLNYIYGGSGNDHIFAYFGHGVIDCGRGYNVVTVDKTTEHAYDISKQCAVVRVGYP
jgi:Ca2+-binding RTX toxin-like protein